MARYVCPFETAYCGNTSQILLNNTGDAIDLNMTIPAGGVCMYEMRAKCGVPAIEPNTTDTSVEISFIQYDDTDAPATPTTTGGVRRMLSDDDYDDDSDEGDDSDDDDYDDDGDDDSSDSLDDDDDYYIDANGDYIPNSNDDSDGEEDDDDGWEDRDEPARVDDHFRRPQKDRSYEKDDDDDEEDDDHNGWSYDNATGNFTYGPRAGHYDKS
jgi:hypothetical protein